MQSTNYKFWCRTNPSVEDLKMLSKLCRKPRATFADPQDEIVISGISGKYPNADNVAQLAHCLYNKVDMVDDAETRWRHTNPEIPRRMGKIRNLEKFDFTFFGIHSKQGNGEKFKKFIKL